MGGRGGCTQPRAAGLGGVLLLWDASDGVPGGGSVCRNAGAGLLAATTPGSDARDAALLVRRDLRRVGRPPAAAGAPGVACACCGVTLVREPGGGKQHARVGGGGGGNG